MFKYSLIMFSLILWSLSTFGMEVPSEDISESQIKIGTEDICINGETTSMLKHIQLALFSHPKHLSDIDFICYHEEKYTLAYVGKPYLEEQEFEQIKNGNFVYLPFYTERERKEEPKKRGAVVLGTQNIEIAKKIGCLTTSRWDRIKHDKYSYRDRYEDLWKKEQENRHRYSFLNFAVISKDDELVKQILESKKINVNKPEKLQETALIIAAKNGDLKMVKLLLHYGANNQANDKGPTAAMLAARGGYIDIVRELALA